MIRYSEQLQQIIKLQTYLRGLSARKKYNRSMSKIVQLQSCWRKWYQQVIYRQTCNDIRQLQNIFRTWFARRSVAAQKLQSMGRMFLAKKNYVSCQKAAQLLRRWFKRLRAKHELKVLFAAIVLQRNMKRLIIRWRTRYYIHYYIKLQHVIKVQALFRGIQARRKLTEDHFAMVISKAQHIYHMSSSLIPDIKAKGSLFHSRSTRKSLCERKIVSKAFKKQLYAKAHKVRLSYELMREGAKKDSTVQAGNSDSSKVP